MNTSSADDFSCLVCGGKRYVVYLLKCQDLYLGSPFIVDYVTCADCALVQQHPLPHDIAALYEVYPVHEKKSALFELLRGMIFFQVYFRSSTASSGQRLLDFGCGDGGYLWRAKKRRLDCVGYEPESGQATAVEKRHGIPVYSDMQKLKAAVGEGFDYITLHFVFEHLDKPSDTMRQLADMLKPGGVIYMTVPALNSWEATFFGRRWSGLDPPRHIAFHNPPHLKRLAGQCGLRLQRYKRIHFANSLAGSLSNVAAGKFVHPLFYLLMPISWAAAFIAPGGNYAAWLEKSA